MKDVFRVSISQTVRGKLPKDSPQFWAWNHSFESVVLTLDEIIDHACVKGLGFAPFEMVNPNSLRTKKENYKACELLVFDIDGSSTLEGFMGTFKESVLAYYTTASHQQGDEKNHPCDRFRVLMSPGFVIEDPALLSFIYRCAVKVYGHDKHAVDHGRAYYGNSNPDVNYWINRNAKEIDWKGFAYRVEEERKRDQDWWRDVVKSSVLKDVRKNGYKFGQEEIPAPLAALLGEESTQEMERSYRKRCNDLGLTVGDDSINEIPHFDREYMEANCELYRNVSKASGKEIFGLLTNLNVIRGFKRTMKEIVEKSLNDSSATGESKKNFLNSARHCVPLRCSTYCSMAEKCNPIGDFLFKQRPTKDDEIIPIITENVEGTVPIELIREKMEGDVSTILDEGARKVFLISASVGIGKTELVRRLDASISLDYSPPTHALGSENQIGEKSPEYPESLKEVFAPYLALGLTPARISGHLTAEQRDEWEKFQADRIAREAARTHRRTYTHERSHALMQSSKAQVLIYDEDPTNAFLKMQQARKDDIQTLRNACYHRPDREELIPWLDEWSQLPEGSSGEITLRLDDRKRNTLGEVIFSERGSLTSNVLGLGAEDAVAYLVHNGAIHYSVVRKFTFQGPIIIMSGTANPDIVNFLAQFSGYEFQRLEYGTPAIRGELVQYTTYSFSKSSMQRDKTRMTQAISLAKKYAEDGWFVIADKSVVDVLRRSGYSNVNLAHFGNTAGTNRAVGKNVLVLGTPYPPTVYLKLMALTMGLQGATEVSTDYHDGRNRRVRWNDFEFRVKVVSDSHEVQQLQLWYIHNQLNQAIGRGRYYTEATTVILCSRFPQRGFCLRHDIREIFPQAPVEEGVSGPHVSANEETSEPESPADDAA